MNQILEQLGTYGIVPVVVLQDAAKAEPLAKALCKGGLACAEVTFRTDAAEESIRIMSEKFPEMLVGAGTVLTTEQADRAVKAGAKFIVSPGLNPEVVKWCQAHEVPVIPGIVTPTEMAQAIGLGLTMVKFFPAEPAGSSVRSTKRTWKPQASSWSANMISPVSVPQGARARRR